MYMHVQELKSLNGENNIHRRIRTGLNLSCDLHNKSLALTIWTHYLL